METANPTVTLECEKPNPDNSPTEQPTEQLPPTPLVDQALSEQKMLELERLKPEKRRAGRPKKYPVPELRPIPIPESVSSVREMSGLTRRILDDVSNMCMDDMVKRHFLALGLPSWTVYPYPDIVQTIEEVKKLMSDPWFVDRITNYYRDTLKMSAGEILFRYTLFHAIMTALTRRALGE